MLDSKEKKSIVHRILKLWNLIREPLKKGFVRYADFFYNYRKITEFDIKKVTQQLVQIYMDVEKIVTLSHQIRGLISPKEYQPYQNTIYSYYKRLYEIFDQLNTITDTCQKLGYSIKEKEKIWNYQENLLYHLNQPYEPQPSPEFLEKYYQGLSQYRKREINRTY